MISQPAFPSPRHLDLSPAQWIWYPSSRTLQNTMVLFRRSVRLRAKPSKAAGWIVADSRYRLFVNGKRVQWGPPPVDPRWVEADPVDLTGYLQQGENIIGAEVLFYGQGDGTWPMGKPGFLFNIRIDMVDGSTENVFSDSNWIAAIARSWKPGQYKRWYLRAFQEEFDARLYPYGWTTWEYRPDGLWIPAMVLGLSPAKPPVCSTYPEYMLELTGGDEHAEIRKRSIPLINEHIVPVKQLSESLWITWHRSPQEYFENLTPDAFTADRRPSAVGMQEGRWRVTMDGMRGAALTFELAEQVVGWPYFTVDAPAGTTIELLVHEAHAVGGPPLLNSHFHSWTRFICKEGTNKFETFDFESCRWIQLHIHNTRGEVTVHDIGVRRRIFPWQHQPNISCSEAPLQRLLDASINTLNNCAQDTVVDGMARERQQYSGDGGHQLHAIYFAFGEMQLPARYVETFSQGMTLDGYFMDCWPAYDRLARLMERQLSLTEWGPLLDHGVGFNFDCWHHYLHSGDLDAIREAYPRLLRFFRYLQSIRGEDGLLPVENIGVPSVYIDHNAYTKKRHKQCAFNLYASAMALHALAPLCAAFGDATWEKAARIFGNGLLAATVNTFWDPARNIFVNNKPWLDEEQGIRLCDRSLATAILFDQCPGGKTSPSLQTLVDCPSTMGFSYPANAGWRLWALAKGGRLDAVVKDLRERWATMDSVLLNNTLQEFWKVEPDSGWQWSHCAVVPLYVLYMSILGLKPLAPGFARYELRPRLADLPDLEATAHTVLGPIIFKADGRPDDRQVTITTPPKGEGELLLDPKEQVNLERLKGGDPTVARYRLPAGTEVKLQLKFL